MCKLQLYRAPKSSAVTVKGAWGSSTVYDTAMGGYIFECKHANAKKALPCLSVKKQHELPPRVRNHRQHPAVEDKLMLAQQ